MSSLIGILDFTKLMIDKYQDENKIAVDMTLGRGNDSLYLQERFKKVYAFDIQAEAVAIAKNSVDLNKVVLINDDHNNVDQYLNEQVKLVIYNLGFLPKINEEITTNYQSTTSSLNKILKLLEKKGLVIIVVYPGHESGQEESIHLARFIEQLSPSDYLIAHYAMANAKDCPYVICIHKK